MQLGLLTAGRGGTPDTTPGATLKFYPTFFTPDESSDMFRRLHAAVAWRQDYISVFGKRHPLPRLQQWFADDGKVYTWSGIRMVPSPWLPELEAIRDRLTDVVGARFNTALANLYRDGNDTVAWHADDEPELGSNPIIASISFGVTRDFTLRHRTRPDVPKVSYALTSGSLLLMSGETQQHWEHSVPRRKAISQARINLTYRLVLHS